MPTYASSKIAQLQVKAQSAWGTAADMTSGTSIIQCEIPSFDFPTELLEIDSIRSGFFSPPPIAGARSGGTLTFKMRMHGWSSAGASGISDVPTEHTDALLLKYALGANLADNYTTELGSGSTTTNVKVGDGTTASLSAGVGIVVPSTTSGEYDLGMIKSGNGTPDPEELTLAFPLSRAVASSGTIYGTNTVFLSTAITPLTFLWTGQNTGQNYTLSDVVVESATISTSPAGHLEIDYSCKVGQWSQAPAGAGTSSYTVTDPYLPVAVGRHGGSLVTTTGSANTELPVGDLTITITNTFVEARQFAASEGIAQYILSDRNVSLSMSIPSTDALTASAWADLVGTTGDAVRYELGNYPGKMFGIYIPSPFYKTIQAEDQGGLHGLSVEMGVGNYSGDTAIQSPTAEASANTDFRIYFG
jgi:hypothetical protein